MKKLIITLLVLIAFGYSQQINHTYGFTTAGVAYTSSGISVDSSSTGTIVFDLQDYYFIDWVPQIYDSVTVLNNSDALFIGTLWFRIDAALAADSTNIGILAAPGGFYYDDGDGNRYETTENNFSTSTITLRDTTTRVKGDVQWTPLNVYFNASTRVLPPEIFSISYYMGADTYNGGSSGTVWFDFAYPAVYQNQQTQRSTTRQDADNRKAEETLK